jgi:RNA polymerase sigma-70 factor, ECF subfamily
MSSVSRFEVIAMTTETLEGGIADPSFEELLRLARQGSNDALGRVLESCRRVLLRRARRQIPSNIHAKGAPSDVVQDTFLEAQRDFQQFAGSSRQQFVAWLSRILDHNRANLVDAYRNRKREVAREVPLDDVLLIRSVQEKLLAPTADPPGVAIEHEEIGILDSALDQLPEQSRMALRLRYIEQMSFEEMGRRLGCSAEAARKVLSRTVKHLSENFSHGATKPHERSSI